MNILSLIKYYLNRKPIVVKENSDIKIMSFNIRCISKKDKGNHYYKIRMPYIRQILIDENPDIIGFQEVKVPQFKYLKKILSNYNYEYQKRDKKKEGEANPVFYKKSRFEAFNQHTFWLSDTYQEMSNTFHGDCYRICSYVCLTDLKNKKKIYIFNTHLDHINEQARIKGIKLIKQIIKDLDYFNKPHLIMGDMNDFYNSPTINELFKEHVDASLFKNQENIPTFHNYGTDQQKIDYIALSKDLLELDYQVIQKKFNNIYPSDHYPIEVIIKL